MTMAHCQSLFGGHTHRDLRGWAESAFYGRQNRRNAMSTFAEQVVRVERCQAFLGRNAERRGLRGRGWALQRLGGVSGGVAIIVVVIILSLLLL